MKISMKIISLTSLSIVTIITIFLTISLYSINLIYGNHLNTLKRELSSKEKDSFKQVLQTIYPKFEEIIGKDLLNKIN